MRKHGVVHTHNKTQSVPSGQTGASPVLHIVNNRKTNRRLKTWKMMKEQSINEY